MCIHSKCIDRQLPKEAKQDQFNDWVIISITDNFYSTMHPNGKNIYAEHV